MRACQIHVVAISRHSSHCCILFRSGYITWPSLTYTEYDRANREQTFSPALSISWHQVTAVAGSETKYINI